jgi:HAD superfamily hydrolase (TIGR01484 family)
VVAALQARGVHVTICTGRMYSGTRHLAERLGIDAPVACVDGSHIVHAPSGRQLHAAPLAHKGAEALLEVLQEFGPSAFAFSDDQVFHEAEGAQYLDYVRTWSEQTSEVGNLLFDVDWRGERVHVTAVVALGSEDQIRGAELALNQRGAGLLQAVSFPAFRAPRAGAGASWGMVVRAAGIDKGTAIDWLCQHYGVAPEEIVAVGDWLNDVPMLQRVGRGFAMAQAPDELKAVASDVLEADAWTGGGLAEAARRAGLV